MRQLVAILIGLSTLGCINTQVHHLSDVHHPTRAPETVHILIEPPDASYTVLAVVESRRNSILHCCTDLMRAVRFEAAQLGGDAVLLGIRSGDGGSFDTGLAALREGKGSLAGQVIVYDREDWIAGERRD